MASCLLKSNCPGLVPIDCNFSLRKVHTSNEILDFHQISWDI